MMIQVHPSVWHNIDMDDNLVTWGDANIRPGDMNIVAQGSGSHTWVNKHGVMLGVIGTLVKSEQTYPA